MSETQNTLAIILDRHDYKEADSLVILYTLEFGKLNLIARGTKKITSKLAGHIEPFNLVKLMIVPGKGLDYLGSAVSQNSFLKIKEDFNKLYFAGKAVSCFNRLVKEGEADSALFNLLRNFFEVLNDFGGNDFSKEIGEIFFSFFVFKLLSELGYQPELFKCLECGKKIVEGVNGFNLQQGGVVCEECFKNTKSETGIELFTISDNCIRLLRYLTNNDFNSVFRLKINKKLIKELSVLTLNYLNFRN